MSIFNRRTVAEKNRDLLRREVKSGRMTEAQATKALNGAARVAAIRQAAGVRPR